MIPNEVRKERNAVCMTARTTTSIGGEENRMKDTIYRQDAIDAICGITASKNFIPLDSAIFNIKKLPSAEQKIIRCKDCIWHLKDDSCARLYCMTDDDFYCWYGNGGEKQ